MILSIILIAINVLVFIFINQGKIDSSDYSLSYYDVSVRKQYFRLFTSAFVHEEIIHLLMNMISLWNIIDSLEYYLNIFEILIFYVITILVGHYFTILMRHNKQDDYTSSIGASGGICGLIGIYFAIIFVLYGGVVFSSIIRSLISIALISFLPNVDGKCHITCLALGLILGFIITFIF